MSFVSNDVIRPDHIQHVVKLHGGDWTKASTIDLKDELVRLAENANSRQEKKILQAIKYLDENYQFKGFNFQSSWMPFMEPNGADLVSLRQRVGTDVTQFRTNTPNLKNAGLFIAKVYARRGSGFRLVYAKYHSTNRIDIETDLPVGEESVDKRNVIFRKTGIEFRCSPNDSKPVMKHLTDKLDALYGEGHAYRTFPPSLIRTRERLFRVLDLLNARLRIYNGSDLLEECQIKGAQAYLDSPHKGLRDLRKLAKLKDRARANQGQPGESDVSRLLSAPFSYAEIEFDFQHPDGFVEQSLKVTITHYGFKFRSKYSEAAISSFWSAVDQAIRDA